MSSTNRLKAVPSPEVEAAPLTFFRHLEYPNIVVHLPGVPKPVRFQGHIYTTTDLAEIAALRAKGGAVVEVSGEPEYRCDYPGCTFITMQPAVFAAHQGIAHQG